MTKLSQKKSRLVLVCLQLGVQLMAPLAASLVSGLAWGAGGGATDVGAAGAVVLLPDDTVKLADSYVSDPNSKDRKSFRDLNPLIQREIERAGYFLVRYGADVDATVPSVPGVRPSEEERKSTLKSGYMSRDVQAKFVIEQIEDPLTVDYYFVDALPAGLCDSSFRSQAGNIPSSTGTQVKEFGCTAGPSTYILKSLFAELSVRDQALAIIHERLHALGLEYQELLVADVVAGLNTVLGLYNQEQITGVTAAAANRPSLTDTQMSAITFLIKRISQMGLAAGNPDSPEEFMTDWQVARNGGGLYHVLSSLSPYAYLGVGSLLGKGGIMDPFTTMMNFSCYNVACELLNGAFVAEGAIAPTPVIPDGWDDFFQTPAFRASIGRGVQFVRSSFKGPVTPAVASDKDANLVLSLDDGSSMTGSYLSGIRALKLGAGASVTDSNIQVGAPSSIPVTLSMGAGAALLGLETLPPSRPNGPWSARIPIGGQSPMTAASIVVPPSIAVDFKNLSVCQDPAQRVLLRATLSLDSPNALSGLCGN
jgi:hypothetical protein